MKIHQIAGLIALCASIATSQAYAGVKIVLGYTGANAFIPAFVAKDQGFFEKHGLDVTMQLVPVGSTIAGAMAGGSLQVGTLTPSALLVAQEGGIDLRIVAGASFQDKNHVTAGVVARNESEIKSAQDFIGKRVGVPGINALQHIAFVKWLSDRGVDSKQIRFVEAFFPQMSDLLRAGQLDAALPVEPFLGRIISGGSGYLVASYTADISPRYVESFYTMTKEFIERNPTAAQSFKAAIGEAMLWMKENQAAARRTQVGYLKFPEELAMTIPLSTLGLEVTREDLQFWIDVSKEVGLIKGTVKPDKILDTNAG
ncbi:ABC transporter substrate-binding protein [Pusillimonas caeni]|uniref:ABC transporter substrate-binding protein n=1 Tax=Pusillimonas caeni TaxID=1348472 RepID=UPI00143110CF|nr:ABC transporter substrate-binding protein [Pusillimonas caeni]